jgi:hypothetical protein
MTIQPRLKETKIATGNLSKIVKNITLNIRINRHVNEKQS